MSKKNSQKRYGDVTFREILSRCKGKRASTLYILTWHAHFFKTPRASLHGRSLVGALVAMHHMGHDKAQSHWHEAPLAQR